MMTPTPTTKTVGIKPSKADSLHAYLDAFLHGSQQVSGRYRGLCGPYRVQNGPFSADELHGQPRGALGHAAPTLRQRRLPQRVAGKLTFCSPGKMTTTVII